MLPVEKLYEACRLAFVGGSLPSEVILQQISGILDKIGPTDVGMPAGGYPEATKGPRSFRNKGKKAKNLNSALRWAPPITYLHLYECKDFSMGIFCLPTSASIPLHNHPGMIVMSKLLYGSMHVKSFDWVDPFDDNLNANPSTPRIAKKVHDRVLTAPCHTETLFPNHGGNIHAFTALTPCAILDVLAPPYDAPSGRHCTYYHELPKPSVINPGVNGTKCNKKEASKFSWLEEYQPPDDFVVQRGDYRGPAVGVKE